MNMKRILSALLAAALLSVCSIGASAFTSDGLSVAPNLIDGTHRWFIDQGFVILENEQPTAAAWFSLEARRTIREYADWPDHNERAGDILFDAIMGNWHSYLPGDGTNTLGNQNGNAKTRLAYWYDKAVSNYKAGNTEEAYQDLGKAMHYLTDLLSPPHVGERSFDVLRGIKIINPLRMLRNAPIHGPYELLASAMKDNYATDTGGLYEWAMETCIEEIGHQNALFSAEHYHILEELLRFSFAPGKFVATVQGPLERGQRSAAGLLYRFYRDAQAVELSKGA